MSFRPSVGHGVAGGEAGSEWRNLLGVRVNPAFRARSPRGATFSIVCPGRLMGLQKMEGSNNAKWHLRRTGHVSGLSSREEPPSTLLACSTLPTWTFVSPTILKTAPPSHANICVHLRDLRFLRIGRWDGPPFSLSPFLPFSLSRHKKSRPFGRLSNALKSRTLSSDVDRDPDRRRDGHRRDGHRGRSSGAWRRVPGSLRRALSPRPRG